MTFVWDTPYEATPSDQVARDTIQWEIQKGKVGVFDRMGVEHIWDDTADAGKHRKGFVRVLKAGNNAGTDVTNPIEGGLYLYDDGSSPHLYKIMLYHSGAWIELSTLDHGTLTGLLSDDHSIYLKNGSVGSDTIAGDLEMGGQLLKYTGTAVPTYGGFLTYHHRNHDHGALGNKSAIKNGVIKAGHLKVSTMEHSGNIGAFSRVAMGMPTGSILFFPQILIETSGGADRHIWICPSPYSVGQKGITLYNAELTTYAYRYRMRYF